MNGHKAKALRRAVYGTEMSPRPDAREYTIKGSTHIVAGSFRAQYQHAKRRPGPRLPGFTQTAKQIRNATVKARQS